MLGASCLSPALLCSLTWLPAKIELLSQESQRFWDGPAGIAGISSGCPSAAMTQRQCTHWNRRGSEDYVSTALQSDIRAQMDRCGVFLSVKRQTVGLATDKINRRAPREWKADRGMLTKVLWIPPHDGNARKPPATCWQHVRWKQAE